MALGWMILSAIGLLLLFLLLAPAGIRFSYAKEKLSLTAHYLFFRFDLSPDTFLAQAGKNVKSEEDKVPVKTKKEKAARNTAQMLDSILDLLRSARGPWNILRRHIVFYRICLYLVICGDDAHQTAIKYAGLSNTVFALLSFLSSVFVVKDPTVLLYPDFSGTKSRYDLSCRISVRPLFVAAALLSLLRRFLAGRMRREPIQTKGGKKHEPTASRQ